MKPHDLGRFFAEFLEGFLDTEHPELTAAEPAPIVVPVDMVKDAVASFLGPLIDAEDTTPTGQQLNMMFDDARKEPEDDLAEATLHRVAQINEAQAKREREAQQGGQLPEYFDPNAPDSDRPWMAPRTG